MTNEQEALHHALTYDEPPMDLNVPAILTAGRRRHRRRRISAVIAITAAAGLTIAGSVVLTARPDTAQPAPAAGARTSPSSVAVTTAGSTGSNLQVRAEQARALCDADGTSAAIDNGWAQDTGDFELIRAYATTSASLRTWTGSDQKSNQTMTAPSEGADLVAICYFSGEFSVPAPQAPPAPGEPEQPVVQTLLGITQPQRGQAGLLLVGDARNIDLDLHHPPVG